MLTGETVIQVLLQQALTINNLNQQQTMLRGRKCPNNKGSSTAFLPNSHKELSTANTTGHTTDNSNEYTKEASNNITDMFTATTNAFIPTGVIKARRQKKKEEGRAWKRDVVKLYKKTRKELKEWKEILTWEKAGNEVITQHKSIHVETVEKEEDKENDEEIVKYGLKMTDLIKRNDESDDDDSDNDDESIMSLLKESIVPMRIRGGATQEIEIEENEGERFVLDELDEDESAPIGG
jgi:hypothetical protein